MTVLQRQMFVSCDLNGVPYFVRNISNRLSHALRNAAERADFENGHLAAVLYNMFVLLERQRSNVYGWGSYDGQRQMVQVHELCAAAVEALVAKTTLDNIKLSTDTVPMVTQLRGILFALGERINAAMAEGQVPLIVPPADQITLENFPFMELLDKFDILRQSVSRSCGVRSVWKVPDLNGDYSLLDSGIVEDGDTRMCVSTAMLPQRLEKLVVALAFISYDRHGPSSFIPQTVTPEDFRSAAIRAAIYSGFSMTRQQAIDELLTAMAPLSRVN